MFFRRFERNESGRDYVVGDIHGCFGLLRGALNRANFNESRDRLFSVGDLVDRGPESERAVEWLAKPWFHAVRGNHEQMAVDADLGQIDANLHVINGGLWFYSLLECERRETALAFAQLPLAIEVDTPNGTFGLVHAEVAGDNWNWLRERLIAADNGKPENWDHIERFVLWGRDVIRGRSDFHGVDGIDRVYVGHTPVRDRQIIGNVHYIDTGACFGKKLTLICITNDESLEQAA